MTVDPRKVSQPADWLPNDYQRLLLNALGDRDPALVQSETLARIRALVDEAGDDLRARADLDLWRRTSSSERARFGTHLERGPESYELTFKLTAGHDLVHMAQARKALDQVRAAHD